MRVEVTQEDISNGVPGKCRSCPIALATRRAVKAQSGSDLEFIEVIVGGIHDPETRKWFTSPEIENFIYRFDCMDHEACKPFTFDLIWRNL